MKKVLLILVLFVISVSNNFGMDFNQNAAQICPELKSISPDASQRDYEQLATKLKINGLSTCECIKYLMEAKERQVFDRIRPVDQHIVQEYRQYVKKAEDLYVQQQAEPNANITIEPEIEKDQILTMSIKEATSRNNIRSLEVGLGRRVEAGIPIHIFWNIISLDKPFLHMNFDELSDDGTESLQATLEHEFTHIKYLHSVKEEIFKAGFEKYGRKTNAKLARKHEAEADRVPDACSNDLTIPCSFKYLMERTYALYPGTGYTCDPYDTHPTTAKRLAWAKRIYNLRVAEEQLKKQNQIATERNSSLVYTLFAQQF